MIGQTISHYKILEKIGEGGMGVVFKAQDLTLDRIVALKFLPSHATVTEEAKARFLQEARSAAALNHPHICTVYGLEEHDGSIFISMEYLDGGTLHSKLPIVSINDALGIAIQIAEALQEAHAKGIVHRDIKADNVMLTGRGLAKVMDFGLAKLKGSMKLTKSSSTVGTLAYMAPEQIEGGAVDARSDIFSFGVLLFEMLTGRYPFQGEHQAAMMYSILNQDPTPLEKVLPSAPAALGNIIAKALEKDPAHRYQSLTDCIVDLSRARRDTTKVARSSAQMRTGSSASATQSAPTHALSHSNTPTLSLSPSRTRTLGSIAFAVILLTAIVLLHPWTLFKSGSDKKTLAVLPFENQAAPEREYFSDGLTDEVTTRLSGLSGLGVIARSSVKEYKKTAKSVRTIGGELNADYVLMGTVRWLETPNATPRIRVTTDLVRVTDGIQVWSQPYEAAMSDVFGLQSMIATQVAQALDVKLLQPERQILTGNLTENPKAYDLYLRGNQFTDRTEDPKGLGSAIQLLEEAIALDPQFAAAHAKLSVVHSDMYWFFYDRSPERIARARESSDRALTLAPQLSEAHAAKGWYYYHCLLDYHNALDEFDLALRYQPNNADVHYGVASVKRRQGDMAGSVISFRKAFEQNPRSEPMIRQIGETLMLDRKYNDAEVAFERSTVLDPSDLDMVMTRARNLLLWKGDIAGARAIVDAGLHQPTTFRRESLMLFRAFLDMAEGRFDAAAVTIDRMNTKWAEDSQFFYAPYPLVRAQFELFRGNQQRARLLFDSAREVLEKLLASRPDDERFRSALGIVYAGLGRSSDAIREAERGVALLPVEKEAWRGTFRLMELAKVHTMLGNSDKAIELLKRLLIIPSELSPNMLRLDPTWKSLRGNKGFEDLLKQGG